MVGFIVLRDAFTWKKRCGEEAWALRKENVPEIYPNSCSKKKQEFVNVILCWEGQVYVSSSK